MEQLRIKELPTGFVLGLRMTIENCLIVYCHSSRAISGISAFLILTKDEDYSTSWRKKYCDSQYSYRVVYGNLRSQIKYKILPTCELHCPQDKLRGFKETFPTKFYFLNILAICQKYLSLYLTSFFRVHP